jgi:hypothetical protein
LIITYFSLSGNTLEERDLLQIYIKGEMIKGALNFRIFVEILSYPYEFLFFRDSIILPVS